jgi:hypothetical protein
MTTFSNLPFDNLDRQATTTYEVGGAPSGSVWDVVAWTVVGTVVGIVDRTVAGIVVWEAWTVFLTVVWKVEAGTVVGTGTVIWDIAGTVVWDVEAWTVVGTVDGTVDGIEAGTVTVAWRVARAGIVVITVVRTLVGIVVGTETVVVTVDGTVVGPVTVAGFLSVCKSLWWYIGQLLIPQIIFLFLMHSELSWLTERQ